MHWYQYLSLGCLAIGVIACLFYFFRLIRLGKPKDFSQKSGSILKAEIYSYTTAMLPSNKESAYRHLPTFTSGIFFHIGTFLSLALFIVFFFAAPTMFPRWLTLLLVIASVTGSTAGLALLIKRMTVKKVRDLSSLDDYFGNLFTTFFQLFTLLYLLMSNDFEMYYYIVTSLLLLYIPMGKLRHAVYFFAARYHLGFFYGWRNTWPPKEEK